MPSRTCFSSAASDGTIDLFAIDGTAAGTREIAIPGASSEGLQSTGLTVVGNDLPFSGVGAAGHTGLFSPSNGFCSSGFGDMTRLSRFQALNGSTTWRT